MKYHKLLKFALPALLMSALMFELLPGSVRFYGSSIPEKLLNFFNLENLPAASYLILAGYATAIAVILALVAAFSKKHPIFKAVSWCSLAAAALTAAPYVMTQEDGFLQPNVMVTLLLTACWLIALLLDKNKNKPENTENHGPRL